MLEFTSRIEGKQAYYGDIRDSFEREGFHLCGNWEYYSAFFDSILSENDGETIYVRLPVYVKRGKLDHADAFLTFGRPFLIKHINHVGFVETDSDFSILDITGLRQFREPKETDAHIEQERKWKEIGEKAVERLHDYVH